MASRRIVAWFLVAAASAVMLERLVPSRASSPSEAPPAAAAPAASPPVDGLASLPAREPISPPRGELFGPPSWVAPPQASERRAPRKPVAPPAPYRVAGQITEKGETRVVLARGDRVFFVREGDTLEGGYRVESIEPQAVTLVYLPLAARERLLVSGAALALDPAASAAGATRYSSR